MTDSGSSNLTVLKELRNACQIIRIFVHGVTGPAQNNIDIVIGIIDHSLGKNALKRYFCFVSLHWELNYRFEQMCTWLYLNFLFTIAKSNSWDIIPNKPWSCPEPWRHCEPHPHSSPCQVHHGMSMRQRPTVAPGLAWVAWTQKQITTILRMTLYFFKNQGQWV